MARDRAFISQMVFDAVSITASGGRLASLSEGGSGLMRPGVEAMSGVLGFFSALASASSDDTSDIVASGFSGGGLEGMSAPAPTAAGFAEGFTTLLSVRTNSTSGVASLRFAGGEVGERSAPAPTAAGLDDRVGEWGAGGSGEESPLRSSFAPAMAKSSADTGRGGVLSWPPESARLFCNSVSPKDITGAGLISGEGGVIFFRAHGLFCGGAVASRGVLSCVSRVFDGGVLGPYMEASFPVFAGGGAPHFGGGERVSFGLLRMILSRNIIRCSS